MINKILGHLPGRRTTQMPYLLVRQKFEDYKRWKPIFDEQGATRQQNGGQGGTLYRNADDPDEAVILFEWNNLENARRMPNRRICGCAAAGWGY
jgi:hypothetical protein